MAVLERSRLLMAMKRQSIMAKSTTLRHFGLTTLWRKLYYSNAFGSKILCPRFFFITYSFWGEGGAFSSKTELLSSEGSWEFVTSQKLRNFEKPTALTSIFCATFRRKSAVFFWQNWASVPPWRLHNLFMRPKRYIWWYRLATCLEPWPTASTCRVTFGSTLGDEKTPKITKQRQETAWNNKLGFYFIKVFVWV